jgi:hypothetical protein
MSLLKKEMKKLWGSPWLEEGEEQHMGRAG